MARQNWAKQGLIFESRGERSWMLTHAASPVAQSLDGDLFRIYFGGRDAAGQSQIGYYEIVLNGTRKVVSISQEPVISLGSLGAFDDRGVHTCCLVNHGGRHYGFYTGWHLGVTVPFYASIGLALSSDGGRSFVKVSAAPVLGRSSVDPYLTHSPYVVIEGGLWRMWYASGLRWTVENGQPKHYYHIKYAESLNGFDWRPTGVVCIDFKSADEYAIARPCVLNADGLYRMWYCYRGAKYRIGYAESRDGLRWERKDEDVGLDVADSGWDSEMLAYPFVFGHRGRLHMLYNGNEYGKTGIGLAILAEESAGNTTRTEGTNAKVRDNASVGGRSL